MQMAHDVEAAHRQLRAQRFLAGLLAPATLDPAACTEFDDFLVTHAELEWVGLFEAAALALPQCRELILDHLFDHHTQPVNPQHLALTLGHAYGHAALRQASNGAEQPNDPAIVGHSQAIHTLLWQIQRIAKVDAPVLINGESGSGKELTAQAIHRQSSRAHGPFVPVNCGAIQPSLIQSELFGHAKGAFTGASRDKRGLIEAASGGTVFLDEIGDLPLELQINLLRFLQEKTINRVGSTQSIHVDVRVIAATNIDLEQAVQASAFREDLYYRLNVLPLHVPALRERKEDIVLLAEHFFNTFTSEKSHGLRGFSRRAMVAMEGHPWPGNVRELSNRVRRAMVMAEGRLITPVDLGLELLGDGATSEALGEARMQAERLAIATSLQQARRNITVAARHLGVSRMTLYRLMAKHGISP
jgi:DNA-binding NtrC family response regulator